MECRCGHDLEEHTINNGFCYCTGYVSDGQSNVGCYCPKFIEKTKEWVESQKKYYYKDDEPSLWERIIRYVLEI